MTVYETIKQAITTLKPISFTYKNSSVRIGNPYAIFIQSNDSTKVHIVQTGGYTSGGVLNIFKPFNLENLNNVKILADNPSFIPNHPNYKPESPYYDKGIIAKV